MGKMLSLFLVVSLAGILMLVSSCGNKNDSPETKEAEKTVQKQWEKILKAISKQDIELFKSFCSSKDRETCSQKTFEDYLKGSRDMMARRGATDYEIASFDFNKDLTEVEITKKNKTKNKFVKEDGDWHLVIR